jgi:polar amino acid transport system permease protein
MHHYLEQIYFILSGTLVTLEYSICGVVFGFIIGMILAILKVSNRKILSIFAAVYTSIFRGTPLLIQLSIIYFGFPGIFGFKLSVFAAGVIAFSLNSGAYVSEILRGGINSVDKGQIEAAKALGISNFLSMRDIVLPQALKTILPSLVNELINLIKESALISIIGEMDLMRRAQIISMQNYSYFMPMIIAAACYYILVLIVSLVGKVFERKLSL